MAHIISSSARRFSVVAVLLSLVGSTAIVPCRLVAQEIKATEKLIPAISNVVARPETSPDPLPADAEVGMTVEEVLKRLRELGADAATRSNFVVINRWNGTDADLNLLSKLPGLRTIDVDLTFVSAEVLSGLKLNRLDHLGLRGVSEAILAKITRLPQCDQLVVYQYSPHSPHAKRKPADPFNIVDEPRESLSLKGYRHLAELAAGVKSLYLCDDAFGKTEGIDDDGLKFIGQIGSLEELQIDSARITDAGLAHLAGHKRLARLTFGSCAAICGPGLTNLAWIETLRYLFIYNAPLKADGVWALASLTQLQELSLMPTDFPSAEMQPADVRVLKHLTHLRTLKIESWTDHTGRRMLALADAEKHLALGNAILCAAGELPALKHFEMHGVSTSAHGIEALAKLSDLEALSLRPVMLDDCGRAAIDQLLKPPNLRLTDTGSVATRFQSVLKSGQLSELTLGNGRMAADIAR
jgi:hypothetical protein